MVVTIDTNILIWGVRRIATPGQEDRIAQSQMFLNWLDKRNDQLVLTADVVSEYLVGDDDDDSRRDSELEALTRNYIVFPYDTKAARIAAKLRGDREFMKQLKEETKKTRVCIRCDIKIVATALAHGVEQLFSNDEGVRKVAKKAKLPARDIPTIIEMNPPKPKDLFENLD
jgi:predicted nucleic acid-binding protein